MFYKPFQQLYHDSDYSQDPFLKLHKSVILGNYKKITTPL